MIKINFKTIVTTACVLIGCISYSNAQVKKSLSIEKAGTLISQLTREGADSITSLKLTGKLNAIDFRHLRDEFKNLKELDLSGADIKTYVGKEGTDEGNFSFYKPDYVPKYAMLGKTNLSKLILPYSIKCIDEEAFKGCNNLQILQLNNQMPPRLGKDAVSDTITSIFVPVSASDNYRRIDSWSRFSIIEGEPTSLTVQIGKFDTLQNGILKASMQPANINFLVIQGKMDIDDFMVIRNYMPNLAGINLSNTTAEIIPEYTFSQKRHLVHIDLPKDLKKIGQRAFSGCSKLGGTLLLPPELTAIEYGAFIDCDHLTRVKAQGNKITAVGDNLFGTDKKKLVY